MRVPSTLATAFGAPFEELISRFATEKNLLPEPQAVRSSRFLSRSVIPHIVKLSQLFNRLPSEREIEAAGGKKAAAKSQASGLDPYWKESSNPANLRLAYFLYFMPSNLYRVASVWAELARLGFRWSAGDTLRAVEFGAGPASGACGIAAGEAHASTGMPKTGNWALIEQDKSMLELGAEWAATYFQDQNLGDWGTRTFHRKVDLSKSLLPRSAPRFNLWVMSYFLNESTESAEDLAKTLIQAWDAHLDDEGVVLLVEPALKLQSRKLLELRQALIQEIEHSGKDGLKVLLPCLGHQACGALAESDDWCHEEVMWWRPPYFRDIDKMAGLDRKTLPFSYLVIAKSKRSREELLPALKNSAPEGRQRLVSPSHSEGRDLEFFICGQDGKRRARHRPNPEALKSLKKDERLIDRGDILVEAEVRGDVHATRIERINRVV